MTGSPLIVITGPTAVGKTQLSLELAATINGEIIGADSRQVYRYMDIGTAKPTAAERATIPHHLIDIVNPDDNLTLSDYQRMVHQTVADIHARGKIPLLIGGTAQYINAIVEGWSIPEVAPNEALRAELETFAADQGSEALFARLVAVDPAAAAKIEHHQNVRRVIRALEVYLETGQPISELQRKQPPPYQILQYVLTMERDHLYDRADRRIEAMMAEGFVAEVQNLLDMGYPRTLPSMSGLGYAQLAAYLAGETSLEAAVEATRIATHKFIRHQYTWFRKYNRHNLWHNVEQTEHHVLINQVQHWLNSLD